MSPVQIISFLILMLSLLISYIISNGYCSNDQFRSLFLLTILVGIILFFIIWYNQKSNNKRFQKIEKTLDLEKQPRITSYFGTKMESYRFPINERNLRIQNPISPGEDNAEDFL